MRGASHRQRVNLFKHRGREKSPPPQVQPLDFVDFVNFTSATMGEDSGGALLMTVLVLNPGPGPSEGVLVSASACS